MRGTSDAIEDYLVALATLLERLGVTILGQASGDVELLEDARGQLSFELTGALPTEPGATRSTITVREAFEPIEPDRYARIQYEYELLDGARDYRRAFHLHFPEWFRQRYLVVVHEHCERPIGRVTCDHFEGSPIKDAFAGVLALMDAWADEAPDCADLRCLEPVESRE